MFPDCGKKLENQVMTDTHTGRTCKHTERLKGRDRTSNLLPVMTLTNLAFASDIDQLEFCVCGDPR